VAGRRTPEAAAERRERRAEVDDPAVVMEAAAAFLAVRPRSVAETRRRLRHLGYRQALVEQVVERLVEMGYLDDEAFAQAWVESRDRARPRGEGALRRELALKGVDHETVAAALEQRLESSPAGEAADLAAALRLLERRRASLEREPDARKRRQKAYALLARNGFDPEVCRDAAARVTTDSPADEPAS
jgi:regulatory protein